MKTKLIFLTGTAGLFLVGAPAQAQQLPSESQQAAPSAVPPAVQPVTHGTTDASSIQDIIVTAERRSVSVQDIPIAISAFDGNQLQQAGVTDPTALNRLVSGLDFRSNTGAGLSLYIRGVGAQPLNGLADQANAFSVDGVFFGRPNGPDTTFYDLERVEVLKGPQGTLYGRNATAGAVNVITRKPRLGERELSVSFTAGNYAHRRAEVAVGLPIGDTLAIRAAVNLIGHDGYYKDGYNDLNTRAGRLHVYFEPSSAVNLLLTVDGAEQRGQGTAYVPFGPNVAEGVRGRFVGDPWAGPSSPAVDAFVRGRGAVLAPTGAPPPAPAFRPRSLTANGAGTDGSVHNDIWSASGTLNVNLGFGTWTTVAGYREIRSDNLSYARWDALYSRFSSDEVSVESRLSSVQGSRLQWIVGGSFNRESQSNLAWPESPTYGSANPASLLPVATDDPDYLLFDAPAIRNKSWAVFGQATFEITPAFRATGGIRYTEDRKALGAGVQGYVDTPYSFTPFPNLVLAPPVPPFFPGVVVSGALSPIINSANFDAVTWTGGVEFDAARHSMVYANVRKGYHAGGLIQGDNVGPNPTTYAPETLIAYSLGSKNRFLNGRVQLNVEAYYWDYRDLQIGGLGLVNCGSCTANVVIAVPQSTLAPTVTNAGRAHTYGLDVDGAFLISPDDLFTLNMLVAHGEYDEYRSRNPFTGTFVSGKGNRLANLPTVSATAGYQHTFPLGDGSAIVAGGRVRYVSRRELAELPFPGSRVPRYTTSDLELTYRLPQNGASITAFVRNLENSTVIASAYNIVDPTTQTGWGTLAPPRTYGLTLSANF